MKSRLFLALLGLAILRAARAEVRCGSADSMAGLMEAWTRGYTAQHADAPARIALRAKFSAEAFDALVRGEIDIAPFSRELFPAERARFLGKFGRAPTLVPVATGSRDTKGGTHAIAIFVNEKNPLARLSLTQLREILARDGRITTWGQLGFGGEWAGKKISVHGMITRRDTGNPPGIVNYLNERLLAGRAWRDDVAEHADVASGPQALELIVRAVAADEAALGYSGFAYAQPGTKTLALSTADTGPCFAGTSDEVARRDYPLSRTIYLCLGGNPDAATREFVRYVRSAEGQRAVKADAEKFLPLPAPIEMPVDAGYLAPSGVVAVVGYNDMQEMLAALCARFSFAHPDVAFALDLKGTRTAPPALATGKSAFAPMGAEFSERELADYRTATGSEPVSFRVAHASLDPRALSGPLAIFVYKDNPLSSLTLEELAVIFSGADKVHGLRPCGVAASAALGLFFQQRVLGARDFSADFVGFPQSADVVKRVGEDPRAIGFAAAMRATPSVKILALAPTADVAPIALTTGNLVAGIYPLDRHLLIYARRPLEPVTREFLRLALSPEGQGIVADGSLGYLPLSARDAATELAKLDQP